MKKEFLTNGEKVRFCDSNIAKMNVLEYWKYYGAPFSIHFKEYFMALGAAVVTPFLILFYPIIVLVETLDKINQSKRVMKKIKRRG